MTFAEHSFTMTKRPSLFLDRDGVINVRIPGDYVRHPDQFIPAEGLEEAMPMLSAVFSRIFVVTNQAGIGKGLMTEDDLALVHQKMTGIIGRSGGRIDRIYHCPHARDAGCRCRKPATGMGWKALAEYQEIEFGDAWMVGDSVSDIGFGASLGMRTVLIAGKTEEAGGLAGLKVDFRFDSLLQFARYMAGC